MKIYISGYRDHWISPYTMLDYVFFWTDWSKCSRWTVEQSLEDHRREKSLFVERPDWCEKWGGPSCARQPWNHVGAGSCASAH